MTRTPPGRSARRAVRRLLGPVAGAVLVASRGHRRAARRPRRYAPLAGSSPPLPSTYRPGSRDRPDLAGRVTPGGPRRPLGGPGRRLVRGSLVFDRPGGQLAVGFARRPRRQAARDRRARPLRPAARRRGADPLELDDRALPQAAPTSSSSPPAATPTSSSRAPSPGSAPSASRLLGSGRAGRSADGGIADRRRGSGPSRFHAESARAGQSSQITGPITLSSRPAVRPGRSP